MRDDAVPGMLHIGLGPLAHHSLRRPLLEVIGQTRPAAASPAPAQRGVASKPSERAAARSSRYT
jgi:hypothetical protein